MAEHVKKVYQSAYFQIRNISPIRKILSDDTASILINALVTPDLTMVMHFYHVYMEFQVLFSINFSGHKMQLIVYCQKLANMIT